MKRHSQEYIDNFLLQKGFKVLEAYKNNRTALKCQCLSCNNIISPTFDNIYKGQGCCFCSKRAKHTLEYVSCFLLTQKIELQSLQYVNAYSELKCKCLVCGNIWLSYFNKIQQCSGCSRCGYLRAAKNNNNSGILYHWKTNEELVWVASYEKAIIEYLNKNKVNYEWQSKIFSCFAHKTYRPDLYLVDENKWVEIKGRPFKKNMEKWEWFSEKYPNSELWDKKKLKEMRIL